MDANIAAATQALLEGLSPELKDLTGKKQRLVIARIGNENGFVLEALLVFSLKIGDYRREMNGDTFKT